MVWVRGVALQRVDRGERAERADALVEVAAADADAVRHAAAQARDQASRPPAGRCPRPRRCRCRRAARALANAIGVPAMSAVPQSGPISSRPLLARQPLERELVLDRHVVGEHQHVQAALRAPCAPRRRRIRPAPRPARGSRRAARRARRRGCARAAGLALLVSFLTGIERVLESVARRRLRRRRAHRDDQIVRARALAFGREQPGLAQQRLVGRACRSSARPPPRRQRREAARRRASAPPNRGSGRARRG